MPSAFEHGPALTVPASNTTAKAAVIWSAASNLGESTIILDSGGNGRIGIAGDLDTITITSGTVTVAGTVAATTLTGAGSGITALNATQLTSGTMPDARFPATLPAISGANLTNLPASGATLSGSTDNTVVTVTGANAMIGETNLTFAGTTLGVGASSPVSMTKMVQIDSAGNAPLIMGTWASGYSGYMTNAYFDGSSWKYVGNGYAMGMRFHFVGGSPGYMFFNVASNNTSGADAALSNWDGSDRKMQIAPDGEVSVRENNSFPSVTQGIAKAWANVASNGSASDSYNCTTGKDSTGVYTITFSTNMENSSYVMLNSMAEPVSHTSSASNYAVGSYKVRGYNTTSQAAVDIDFGTAVLGEAT